MNAHDNFAGTGMRITPDERRARIEAMQQAKEREAMEAAGIREAFAEPPEADDLMTEALAEDLAKELPTATLLAGKRGVLERTIVSTRAEMAKQQQIAASALDKFRQLKISLRVDEDALDGLLVSEVP